MRLKTSKSKNTILYIHGGAFVNEVNLQHLFYSYILSRKLNAYVLVPVYPLTPDFNYSHSFKLIEELYACMLDEYDNIIFMGDSAGGGFIFSFCQFCHCEKFFFHFCYFFCYFVILSRI